MQGKAIVTIEGVRPLFVDRAPFHLLVSATTRTTESPVGLYHFLSYITFDHSYI